MNSLMKNFILVSAHFFIFASFAKTTSNCKLKAYCLGLRDAPNHKTFGLTLAIERGEVITHPKNETENLGPESIGSEMECREAAAEKAAFLEALTLKDFDPSLADDENYIDYVACQPFVKWSYKKSSGQVMGPQQLSF